MKEGEKAGMWQGESSETDPSAVEGRSYKMLRFAENDEDRISALHDSLIQHILSFLPWTEDVIRTSILSKRWRYVWTHVPNLKFSYEEMFTSILPFANFIDKTLNQYASPKIQNFTIVLNHDGRSLRNLGNKRVGSWILFAIERNVEKLTLDFHEFEDWDYYSLPEYFYNNRWLSELKTTHCDFLPDEKVVWKSLKVLKVDTSNLTDEVVEKILSGCPMLETLKLSYCPRLHRIFVSSKCLKKLVIDGLADISCTGEKYVSTQICLEISCPYVEKLKILDNWGNRACKLMDVSSLASARLDFFLDVGKERGRNFYKYVKYQNIVKQLLEKLHHVKNLRIGKWCIQVLSILEVKRLPSPLSNHKCLTLSVYDFDEWDLPGIANILRSSPELEKLTFERLDTTLQPFFFDSKFEDYYDFGDNYLASLEETFPCLSFHLKTVEILNFDEESCGNYLVNAFVAFLLKNAKVLEKVVIGDLCLPRKTSSVFGFGFGFGMAERILTMPIASPNAVVVDLSR